MNFEFKVTESGTYNLIELKGQLIEKHQGDELINDVDDLILKESNNFILDLNGLDFMNDAGFDILISILTKARTNGGDCVISEINPALSQLFSFKNLTEIFTVVHDVNDASVFINQH